MKESFFDTFEEFEDWVKEGEYGDTDEIRDELECMKSDGIISSWCGSYDQDTKTRKFSAVVGDRHVFFGVDEDYHAKFEWVQIR